MGWNNYNAYGKTAAASLIEQTALAVHNNGMQAAGYDYVNTDDAWMEPSRDSSGNLGPNPSKFPTA
jgi:alpha-galactosidase